MFPKTNTNTLTADLEKQAGIYPVINRDAEGFHPGQAQSIL